MINVVTFNATVSLLVNFFIGKTIIFRENICSNVLIDYDIKSPLIFRINHGRYSTIINWESL